MGDSNDIRVAVIAHVFYPEIWPELLLSVRNIVSAAAGSDVFVTLAGPACNHETRIRDELPAASVFCVENIGYDVAPFFSVLDRLDLATYDIVVKLHTKRDTESCWLNFRKFMGSGWHKELLSFCSSPKAAARTLAAFGKCKMLGMVAGMKLYDPCGVGAGCDFAGADGILRSLGMTARHCAVYGTMFAMRASLLKPLQGHFSHRQFIVPGSPDPHHAYGLSGDLEMCFAMVVDAQGFYVGSGRLPDVVARAANWLKMIVFCCLRFLSDHIRGMTQRVLPCMQHG